VRPVSEVMTPGSAYEQASYSASQADLRRSGCTPVRRMRGADPLSRASRLRMLARLKAAAATGDIAAAESLVRLSLSEEGRRAASRLEGRK
jgi:hypothetical protein